MSDTITILDAFYPCNCGCDQKFRDKVAFNEHRTERLAELRKSADAAHLAASNEAARASKAEAENRRLTALLEDRQGMARIIEDELDTWSAFYFRDKLSLMVADRLIAYLKPLG